MNYKDIAIAWLGINFLKIPNFWPVTSETGCESHPLIALQIQVINLCWYKNEKKKNVQYTEFGTIVIN